MDNAIKRLAWDSAFFNQEIAHVQNAEALNLIDYSGYDLVTLKLDAGNYSCITEAQEVGFAFVESEVVFSKTLISHQQNQISELNIATENDLEAVKAIARNAYSLSRYRLPYFDKNDRDKFYSTWIENAVRGEFDDVCLVIREQSKVAGYISLKKDATTLKVGLIAVAEGFQGKGIGKRLLVLAEQYAYQASCSVISVATQISNIGAINLYLKFGFTCQETSHWFYRGKV